MGKITWSYPNKGAVGEKTLREGLKQLLPEVERVRSSIQEGGYDSLYASVNLPDDELSRVETKRVVEEKKKYKPTMLVVVGIGGSSLGAAAVHQALFGTLYNDQQPDITFYVADTVDTDYINDIVLLVEQELEKGSVVIINIVSKSGTTIETVTNAELFTYLLRKAYPHVYRNYIVITTDEDSELWNYAQEQGITRLAIPKNVGGRYSVFSSVGLFPLALLGIDIDALCQGARDMRYRCALVSDGIVEKIEKVFENNPAIGRALLLFEYYKRGIAIHDLFVFSKDLSGVGAWYRQLVGESLGKEGYIEGEIMPVGILPTVSIGTVDLHSVAQLYLGGPPVRFTTFVDIAKNNTSLVVDGTSMITVMNSIMVAVQKAYYKHNLPFMTLTIPEKNAYHIGGLMQMHMLEIIYLGFLLGVDPFDQPHVELYKKEVRALLR